MNATDNSGSVSGNEQGSTEEVAQSDANLQRWYSQRNEELEATNKELESFTYSVSHDLRSPLRSILGYSKILIEEYSDVLDEEGQMILRRQVEAAQRMERLISDLLEFSRLGRQPIVPIEFDLTRLAYEVADEVVKRWPKQEIQFDIHPNMRARADSALIRFVLQNLFENSVKYSFPKGKAEIEFGQDENGAYFVRDRGIGFDMAYVNKLFKPFERLHSASEFPGTGIGLTNVQRVIFRHGGKVWAEGAVNEGATFFFTLGSRPAEPRNRS